LLPNPTKSKLVALLVISAVLMTCFIPLWAAGGSGTDIAD
jgi:hypothetical protein